MKYLDRAPRGFCKTSPKSLRSWIKRMDYAEYRFPWLNNRVKNCPVGWLPIVEIASISIFYVVGDKLDVIMFEEKFGALAWYVRTQSMPVWDIIRGVEQATLSACAVCGSHGEVKTRNHGDTARQTLCEPCTYMSNDEIVERMYPLRR